MKKESKKKPDKYEEKLHVKGTLEGLVKASVSESKPKAPGKDEKEQKKNGRLPASPGLEYPFVPTGI